MINPTHRFKKIWDSYVVAATVFAAIEIPARLTLSIPLEGWLKFMDWWIIGTFSCDIVLHFITAYSVKGKLVTDRKSIAFRYLKSWLILDLIATIPFDVVLGGFFNGSPEVLSALRLFRLARLLKLAKVAEITGGWQASGRKLNRGVMRLILFAFWILVLAHFVACGWILLGAVADKTTASSKYLTALYWCVTTLTTVGYGDLTPKTNPQIIYTMVIMFLGVGVYGYVIGNIASLLANLDVAKAQQRKKIEEMTNFFGYRNISQRVQNKVRDYYEHIWANEMTLGETALLEDLPRPLQIQISLELNRDILEKVPLFKNASEEFISALALRLKPAVYMPKDYIIKKGETGDEMYFISHGDVQVVAEDGQTVYATLSDGAFFGEMALVMDSPRSASIRAVDFTDVYTLDKATFTNVLGRFPDIAQQIRKTTEERLKELGANKARNGQDADDDEGSEDESPVGGEDQEKKK